MKQLCVSNGIPSEDRLDREKQKEFFKPENLRSPTKPKNGPFIWTSTQDKQGGSEWIEFACYIIPFVLEYRNKYLLKIKNNAKLFELNIGTFIDFRNKYLFNTNMSKEEFDTILNKEHSIYFFKLVDGSTYVDFNKLIEDGYDGIHLWNRPIMSFSTKCADQFYDLFNGWDCESTLFWNWVFEDDIEYIGSISKEDVINYDNIYSENQEDDIDE